MNADYCIILISDTHVGDRTNQLSPQLIEAIRDEAPNEIWHAGDICEPGVIDTLNQIAPTIAVEGNRDWFLGFNLPREIIREINNICFVLTHGHVSIKSWALNYLRLFTTGRQASHVNFQRTLSKLYPEADVIIYGHVHKQLHEVMDGQRFINPGAGYPERRNKYRLHYVRLDINQDGSLRVDLKSMPADLA